MAWDDAIRIGQQPGADELASLEHLRMAEAGKSNEEKQGIHHAHAPMYHAPTGKAFGEFVSDPRVRSAKEPLTGSLPLDWSIHRYGVLLADGAHGTLHCGTNAGGFGVARIGFPSSVSPSNPSPADFR